ncbi:IS66 family insertion sequence element accessory protein TnpA, partial [Escherichia coli]|uniref:IS66 family insertion sequence element accessory protein TnpA n=2 Tax=Enterobacterales TaxID=91347 RepID=UPI003EB9CDE8
MPAVVNHAILQALPLYAKVRNLMAKKMTPAQRRQHYDAWRVSGMSRAAYARQHGINNKTFWHLCRAFSADDARGPAPADNRPAILP